MARDGVGAERRARARPVGAEDDAAPEARPEARPEAWPEAALVERAKTDPHAFGALYDRYAPRVYRYCRARLGSREAAEDATGQTFTAALAALPRYRERGSFAGWLFAIAHNAIVDAGRAARPERAARSLDDAAVEAVPDPAAGPEEEAMAAEARASVLNLLPRLPDDQRRVLELRLAGLTGPEVARALGRSHGSVRVVQSRAVARLRTLLAEPIGKTEQTETEGHDG